MHINDNALPALLEPEVTDRISLKYRSEQIRMLFNQLPSALTANIVSATFLFIILWHAVPLTTLSIWYLVLILVTAFRAVLYNRFMRDPQSRANADVWLRRFIFGCINAGAVWGFSWISLISNDSVVIRGIVVLWVCGMCAGAVSSLSVVRHAFFAFTIPAVLPTVLYLLYMGAILDILLACALIMFFGFLLLGALRAHKDMNLCLKVQFQNTQLLRSLEVEKARVQEYNEVLEQKVKERTRQLEQTNISLEKEIGERRQVEESLRKSQALYKKAEKMGLLGHWEWDELAGKMIACSDGYAHIFQKSMEQVLFDSRTYAGDLAQIHPDDQQHYDKLVNASMSKMMEGMHVEYRIITPDGTVRHIFETSEPEFDSSGKLIKTVGTLQDITERKLAEERLRQANENLASEVTARTIQLEQSYEDLRNLSARLEIFRQEERIRISHDIHEVIGQPLASLKIDLAWIMNKLPKKYSSLHAKSEKMLYLLSSCMDKVRLISTQLHPPILGDFGLTATVEWVAQDFSKRTGIDCVLDISVEANLTKKTENVIYLIFSETIKNVSQNIGVDRIWVSLSTANDNITLVIKYNCKEDTEDMLNRKLSPVLLGMKDHIEVQHGGVLEIIGYGEGNILLTALIPVSPECEQSK